jgi:mxaJ protein
MYSAWLASVALLLAGSALPAAARDLRVCAEPENLPFSDREGHGYENRIAAVAAAAIDARLVLVPVVQTGFGYLRATLGAGRCDALFGLPQGTPRVEQTLPN